MTLAALHHTQGDYATGTSAAEGAPTFLETADTTPGGNDQFHGGENDIASIKSEKLCTRLNMTYFFLETDYQIVK